MSVNLPSYNSSNIRTLTALEDFRLNSQQYIGSNGLDTDCQLLKEIIDNAADEAIIAEKIYNIKILFFTNGKSYQVAVIDHGRGIPCDMLEDVYTKRSTSGKYDTKAYFGISTGTWGVGSKLVAALSTKFIAISKRLDGFGGVEFECGITKNFNVRKQLDNNADTVGTSVFYQPDKSFLYETESYMTDPRGIDTTLKLIEYISAFKPNVKFEVYKINHLVDKSWYDADFVNKWEYLQTTTGNLIYRSPDNFSLFEYAKKEFEITDKTVLIVTASKLLNLNNDNDKLGYDLKVGLTRTPSKQCGIVGVVNGNPLNNVKSSHINVLHQQLKKHLRQYLDEDNNELKVFFDSEYTLPLHGYVNAQYKNAKFISQQKTSFESSDFARVYGQSIDSQFSKLNNDIWEQMFDLIAEDLKNKFLASNNKTFQTGKSLKNAAFKISRIGSYIPCAINNSDVTELLITEGNSAGDYAKQIRNENFQAILKLRGKPLNTMKANPDELRKNEVYMDLMRLCGVGPRDTDLTNFNYKSIGLLADADPDGYHIVCLLIACLHRINPLILESGRVWIANPPLYVHETKDQTLYLRDQKALDDARVQIYSNFFKFDLMNLENNKVCELKNESYRDFVYLVKRVGAIIKDVATKLVIDPFILEQLTLLVDCLSRQTLDCDRIKKFLNLERCQYEPIANVLLLVSNGSEIAIPLDRLTQEIRAYILPEVTSIHWGKIQPLVTTITTEFYNKAPMTFMQINKIFDDIDSVYHVRRIKGLGECLPEQLKYSCLDPATRTFTTIKSIGDVDRLYKLLGVDPQWRKELAKTQTGELIGELL